MSFGHVVMILGNGNRIIGHGHVNGLRSCCYISLSEFFSFRVVVLFLYFVRPYLFINSYYFRSMLMNIEIFLMLGFYMAVFRLWR